MSIYSLYSDKNQLLKTCVIQYFAPGDCWNLVKEYSETTIEHKNWRSCSIQIPQNWLPPFSSG